MYVCQLRKDARCDNTFIASTDDVAPIKCKTYDGISTATFVVWLVVSSLMLLTGPASRETVRWQIQSLVSQRAIVESDPPVARYLPVGDISAVKQDDVWPWRRNSSDSPSSTG